MKSFKDHLLTETPMKSTFEDIYKRKNKENFFNKAVKGELELEAGGKVKAISKDDFALKAIMAVDDETDLDTASIRAHLKTNWGIGKIGDISKDMNGFSIREGGKKPSGEDWESIIAVAVNKISGLKYNVGEEWERAEKFWGDYEPQGMKLGQEFIKKLKVKSLKQLGASTAATSPTWDAPNKTPKTDLIYGKQHISLKMHGNSQLMSGKKEEVLATFKAAQEEFGESKAGKVVIKKVMDILEEKMITLTEKGTVKSIDALRKKTNISDKELDRIAELDQGRLQASEINDELDNIFKSLPFKSHVAFEAATGRNKFAPSPKAIANLVVVFKDTGSITETLKLDSAAKAGMILAKGNEFYVSFKSGGVKSSKPYLSLRTRKLKMTSLQNSYADDTFRSIIMEEINKEGLLTEDMQQLDEFALFNKLASKVKDVSKSVISKVSKAMKAILERVKKVFQYIYKLGKQAVKALMNFFGVEIGKVKITKTGGIVPLVG